MSDSDPSLEPRGLRPGQGFWPVFIINAVLGWPAYFISFLFAYGFRDKVGLSEHLTFLVLIAIFATVAGFAGAAFPTPSLTRRSFARRATFGVRMSLALNSAVVGVGSIVSAMHKDENSVSADFSTTTDVLVGAGLFVVAAAFAVSAVRANASRHRT